LIAFDDTAIVRLFNEGMKTGVVRFALLVRLTFKVPPVLFRTTQNTPPSLVAVEAGSVRFEKELVAML
jgi:hypothetical protein